MIEQDIAMEELFLNIKHQDIQVKEFMKVGYEWDDKTLAFVLMFPKKIFPFRLEMKRKCWKM